MHQIDNIIPLKIKIYTQTLTLNTKQSKTITQILTYLQQQKIILHQIPLLVLKDYQGQLLQPQRPLSSIRKQPKSGIIQLTIQWNQQQIQQKPTRQYNTNRNQYIMNDDILKCICTFLINNQQNGLKQMRNQGIIIENMYRMFEKMGVKMSMLQEQNKNKENNQRNKLINQNKCLMQKLKAKQKQIEIANQIMKKIIKQGKDCTQQIQRYKNILSKQTLDNLILLQQQQNSKKQIKNIQIKQNNQNIDQKVEIQQQTKIIDNQHRQE